MALEPADGLVFDLSTRIKLRVAGEDRLRFLNGQLTNDARKATTSNAVAACILNAKGKLDAHVFVSADADAFMIDAEPELTPALLPRLQRYVIADDVELKDVSERLSIFHLLNDTSPNLAGNCRIVSANRFQKAGWDIWLERPQHDETVEKLFAQFAFCDAEQAEVFRIERGVPRWGHELTADIIPVEANLEDSCIDYEKGCYIGQEVISRMKRSGQRNKKLCGLVAAGGAQLAAGMRLTTAAAERKEVGWITSVTDSKRVGKQIALGYVKRGWNSTGAELVALGATDSTASMGAAVVIVDLPFV